MVDSGGVGKESVQNLLCVRRQVRDEKQGMVRIERGRGRGSGRRDQKGDKSIREEAKKDLLRSYTTHLCLCLVAQTFNCLIPHCKI